MLTANDAIDVASIGYVRLQGVMSDVNVQGGLGWADAKAEVDGQLRVAGQRSTIRSKGQEYVSPKTYQRRRRAANRLPTLANCDTDLLRAVQAALP